MDLDRLYELEGSTNSDWSGDNAMQGLLILQKYADGDVILGAEHDKIYSISPEEAINNGLTEEDAIALFKLNWGINEYEDFYCYV